MGRSLGIACFAALIVLLACVAWWVAEPTVQVPSTAPIRTVQVSMASPVDAATRDSPSANDIARREAVEPATPQGEGSLVVRARHVRGDLPAAGMNFRVIHPIEATGRVLGRGRTDAWGVVAFANLPAGLAHLHNDRRDAVRSVTILADATTEVEFAVQQGLRFTGLVVDTDGQPVAGVPVVMWQHDAPDVQHLVAVSDAVGAFAVLDAHIESSVGARLAGFRTGPPLRMRDLKAEEHNRLELGPGGSDCAGFVVDATGAPIVGAVVEVGAWLAGKSWPAIVRTDRFGRFHAIGLATGTQPLLARAEGRAPFRSTIDVGLDLPMQRIVLQFAARLCGIVRGADGQPVQRARVRLVDPAGAGAVAVTGEDGSFEIQNVPIGDLRVEALAVSRQIEGRVTTIAGQTSTLDLQFAEPTAGRTRTSR